MFEDGSNVFANYIEEDAPGRAQFMWVALFYYLTKVCRDEHGSMGEGVMRQAVREFGTERAYRKRQRADALGMAPNLVTMSKIVDLYSDPRFDFGKQVSNATPEEKIIQVYTCPNSNIWARLEGKRAGDPLAIGSIYCEEVHHYLYGMFDPSIQMNLCEILTKGDALCNFRLNMRPANRKPFSLPPYQPQSWEDFGNDVTASIISVYGLHLYHYGQSILDNLGEQTLKDGLTAYARCRGERLRELERRRGRRPSIQNLVEEGDLFLDPRTQKEIAYTSDGSCTVTLKRSIIHEVLHCHQAAPLAAIYFKTVFPALCRAYDPALSVSLEHSDGQGGNFTVTIDTQKGATLC